MATGHSARDVHELLAARRRAARGEAVRDGRAHRASAAADRSHPVRPRGRPPKLPAAAYRLAFTPDDERGAFSFCMCPGGWIVPASTEPDGARRQRHEPVAPRLAVRELRASSSSVELADLRSSGSRDPLGGVELQRALERAAALAGGGELRAPATRATDFVKRRGVDDGAGDELPAGPARRPTSPTVLDSIGVPLAQRLREALQQFDRQMRGYLTEEAVLVGVESRTSSPVRVPRDQRAARVARPRRPVSVRRGRGLRGRHRVGGARRDARRACDHSTPLTPTPMLVAESAAALTWPKIFSFHASSCTPPSARADTGLAPWLSWPLIVAVPSRRP